MKDLLQMVPTDLCGAETSLLMMHLINKFFPPERTILNFHINTASAAIIYLLVSKHYKFLLCDADNSRLFKATCSIMEVFVHQALSVEPEMGEPVTNQNAVRSYLLEKIYPVESRQRNVWRSPRWLRFVQLHLHHIVSMFPQYVIDMTLFLQQMHPACTLWNVV